MKKFHNGRLRGSTAAGLVVLLTAMTGTGLYGSAAAQPVAAAATEKGRTVLVLDSSGSMSKETGDGKTKIEAAKSALRTVVQGLPDDAEVGLRVFGATVEARSGAGACQDSQVVVEPGFDNRDALLNEIDKYKPYGETPIPHALREAAKDLGDDGARSIVLVSDGESTCDPDPCVVAEEIAEDGIDLRIDVVGLSVDGKARSQLQCIAESGNGEYFDAKDAGEIEATLTKVTGRGVQPFSLEGTSIDGGTASDPTPITPGKWKDLFGDDEEKFYTFERKQAGSTLRVSALTQGAHRSMFDSLNVEIVDPDGESCARQVDNRGVNTRLIVGAQASAGEYRECDRPGTYTVKVTRDTGTVGAVPVSLRVTEEPPVTDPGFAGAEIPAGQISFRGRAKAVAGSASFEEAPELTNGLWSSGTVPGEVLVYRFRLEYGQSATAGVRFPAGTAAQDKAFGHYSPMGEVSLQNPMMATLGSPRDAESYNSMRVAEETSANFLVRAPQVSRVTGQDRGSSGGGADFTVPGDYYLMVGVQHADELVELPFQIELKVEGEPQQGPTYVDDASWSVADQLGDGEGSSGSDGSGDSEKSAAADAGDSSALRTGLGIATGLVAVAVLGWALLLRRRRSTT